MASRIPRAPTPILARLGDDFFAAVPASPGVYFFLGQGGELLYIGKAKRLRARLRSYTREPRGRGTARTRKLLAATHAIRYEPHATDEQAVRRETELLRALRPAFNVSHNARSEHAAIVLIEESARIRLQLRVDPRDAPDTAGARMYGCFPFEAGTPSALYTLLHLLATADPARSTTPAESSYRRASGGSVRVDETTKQALDEFLSGRSTRLLPALSEAVDAASAARQLPPADVTPQLRLLRAFFAAGPRRLRDLQAQHRRPPGPLSASDLRGLLELEYSRQIGARSPVDIGAAERRIGELRTQGLSVRSIVRRLNAEGVPTALGDLRWRMREVSRIVDEQIRDATRSV